MPDELDELRERVLAANLALDRPRAGDADLGQRQRGRP